MLKATSENFPIRGLRVILRRIDTKAWVSFASIVAEFGRWGAKFIRTLTSSGASSSARFTGGSFWNCSSSVRLIVLGGIATVIRLSFDPRAESTSLKEEQNR